MCCTFLREKRMKKTILEIYALAVCFIVIICFSFALGLAVYDLIQIKYPSFTLSAWQYEQYQSNENFCLKRISEEKLCTNKTTNDITRLREAAYISALEGERRDGRQGIVKSVIIFFVCLFVFIPHWLIARRART